MPPPPPVHIVVPAEQVHVPFEHVAPRAHALPQLPQFCAFVERSTQTVIEVPPPGPIR
jgi:hypothetical protein